MAVDTSLVAFRQYLLGLKSPATAQKYTEYAGHFLKLMQENGYTGFSQLPRGFLSEFASALSGAHRFKASTVRVQVYAVKKYLEWVRDRGVPVPEQAMPELRKDRPKHRPVMAPDMLLPYFRQADLDLREPLRTAAMLLPCCGLRGQEMVSLKLEHIHRAELLLANGKKKSTLFLCFAGKGGKERNVPLMEEGVEILTGYLTGWRKRQKGIWLFPAPGASNGAHHIHDRTLRMALQKLREPLGTIDFTPHTMRRTYITMLWRKKVDLGTIAKIAGHSSVQTTLDHYIIMDPNDNLAALYNAGGSLTDQRRNDGKGSSRTRHRTNTQSTESPSGDR